MLLCDSCSAALANADLTALDPATAAALSDLPLLVPGDPRDPGGYWSCDGCGEICIGAGTEWEEAA